MAAIGSSNIGFQLLKKSGWKEGTGLGAQEQGRLEPVETRVKNNKRGLGSKEPKPKPKVEDDVETNPQRPKQEVPSKKRAKLAAKRIRKMQEEEKRLKEKEFEMAFYREFWPDNVKEQLAKFEDITSAESLIFPCSDFRYVVATSLLLHIFEYVMRCPIQSVRDIAVGSFLCSMVLVVAKESKSSALKQLVSAIFFGNIS